MPARLALQLAEVFGGQVDFNSDMQPGDHFEALFDKDFRDGEFSGYGARAAVLVNGGRHLQAFRFMQGDGRAGGSRFVLARQARVAE